MSWIGSPSLGKFYPIRDERVQWVAVVCSNQLDVRRLCGVMSFIREFMCGWGEKDIPHRSWSDARS